MKKIISMIMALTMIFALAMTASAIDIEITAPAGDGDKSDLVYTAYKVFSASVDDNGTTDKNDDKAVYTFVMDEQNTPFYDAVYNHKTTVFKTGTTTDKVPGTTNEYYVTVYDGVTAEQIANALKTSNKKGVGKKSKYEDGKFIIEGVEEGYYYIESSFGTGIVLDTIGKNTITVDPKNDLPTIEKKIVAVGNLTGISVEEAMAQPGSPITFELTVKIPATAPVGSTIEIYDIMEEGLDQYSWIEVDANGIIQRPAMVTWNPREATYPIAFIYVNQDIINQAAASEDGFLTVSGTYQAILNANAVTGETGNKNKAYIKYETGNDGDTYTSQEQEVIVYTGEVKVYKHTGTGDSKQPLPGAGFVLKTTHGTTHYYKNESGTVTWVDSIDQATEYFSGSEGYLVDKDGNNVSFMGLLDGVVYSLEEKTVPAGYNKAEDKSFKITNKGVTVETDGTTPIAESTIEVENKTGALLPSTGGMGTTLFYILGSLMAVGALVVLVTNKRVRV